MFDRQGKEYERRAKGEERGCSYTDRHRRGRLIRTVAERFRTTPR